MEKPLPNRQSIRMKGWDYTTPGWYFITCNTHGGRSLFGTIVNGRMVLNPAGRMVEKVWRQLPEFYPGIAVDDAAVVMPNHFHGIVRILIRKGAGQPEPSAGLGDPALLRRGGLRASPILAVPDVMRNFKSFTTTQFFRNFAGENPPPRLWHRNYWDVIVRDEKALANIRRYIRDNPRNYEHVLNCGEPRMLGNPELLKLRKVGFLASRGANEPGVLTLKPGEAILSGFLSPMERRVFRAGLSAGKPMIWVKPWGLGEELPDIIRRAVAAGRLLILSPFDDSIEVPNAKRAIWCNEYVVAHSDRVVIGHLNPDGLLACILSEVPAEVEIERL